MRRLIILILLLGLGLSTGSPPVAAAEQSSECLDAHTGVESDIADIRASVNQSSTAADTIRITYDTRTLDSEFSVDVPQSIEVVATRGFSYDADESRYRYTGGDRPFVEYRIGVAGERRQYASGDEWIFAPTPTHIGVGVNLHPRPSGVVGDQFLYIGNYTQYTTSQGCHEINLVVAAAGQLESDPSEVIDVLRYAAVEHDVGHRYDTVRIFVTPGNAQPGVSGFAETNDAWVTSTVLPDTRAVQARIIVHEYLHTRQAFGGAELRRMSWFNEGLADYYSYKVMLDRGMIRSERYNQWLENGSRMTGALTAPETWESRNVEYTRSGAFFAVLDAKIQNTSNASLENVVKRVNGIGGPESRVLVQERQFLTAVRNVSTNSTAAWANATMSNPGQFDIEQATVDQPSAEHWLLSQAKQRIRDKPFATVYVAFLSGVLVVVLINEVRNGQSDPK